MGAGTGLPSLVCAHLDAKVVVITDYPDSDLIENISYNINHCKSLKNKSNVHAEVGTIHSYYAVRRLTPSPPGLSLGTTNRQIDDASTTRQHETV